MMALITYDVNITSEGGTRRLRKVARTCQNYGQRVQNSVFECLVDPTQWAMLRHELLQAYDSSKNSLRFYFLGANWKRRVEHQGAKETYDPEGPLCYSNILLAFANPKCVLYSHQVRAFRKQQAWTTKKEKSSSPPLF